MSFPNEVKQDTTLYAGWKQVKFTVTFKTDGGSDVADMAVETIQTFPSTSYSGNIFIGWFADSNFNNEVQFPYPDRRYDPVCEVGACFRGDGYVYRR